MQGKGMPIFPTYYIFSYILPLVMAELRTLVHRV